MTDAGSPSSNVGILLNPRKHPSQYLVAGRYESCDTRIETGGASDGLDRRAVIPENQRPIGVEVRPDGVSFLQVEIDAREVVELVGEHDGPDRRRRSDQSRLDGPACGRSRVASGRRVTFDLRTDPAPIARTSGPNRAPTSSNVAACPRRRRAIDRRSPRLHRIPLDPGSTPRPRHVRSTGRRFPCGSAPDGRGPTSAWPSPVAGLSSRFAWSLGASVQKNTPNQTAASTCRQVPAHAPDDVRAMRQETDVARVFDDLESSSRNGLREVRCARRGDDDITAAAEDQASASRSARGDR